ncbi:MAG TPA: glycosyltransferase family 4 protein [Acetobacteraceae bacterium]|nr:glycosyltransferase family 4 protein [Acetobacteraceae bacterium]
MIQASGESTFGHHALSLGEAAAVAAHPAGNGTGRPIAIVLPPREDFSPAASGAIGIVVHQLARTSRPGFSPLVIGPASPFPPYPDVAFTPVRPRWWPPGSHAWRYARAVLHGLRDLEWSEVIRAPTPRSRSLFSRVIRTSGFPTSGHHALAPSLIEVHNRPDVALFLAERLADSKVVLFLHNDPLGMRAARACAARQRLLARLARVVTVSGFLRGRMLEGIAETGRVCVLPNPIVRTAVPVADPSRPREKVLLFAGRVVRDKGADAFVAAVEAVLPRLPGWRAEMFGADRFGPDSPENAYLRALRRRAASAGIAMRGYRPQAEVLAAMARGAIVVVPSRWEEPFGLTALEAMAAGAALITTRRGALPEVAGTAARYAEPDPPEALAEAIHALANDEPGRVALGAAGQARAREFDLERVASRLDRLRREVLDS